MTAVGTVAELRCYPVKSMLGESLAEAAVGDTGIDGDRRLALLDVATGRVATAKHPRLWRTLLQVAAARADGEVWITLPDGRTVGVAEADGVLSELLGRPVRLAASRPPGASVERPAPEDVLEHGVEAEVPYETLEIAQGSPGDTFVDAAPVHLVTTATLDEIGTEAVRYRPNVVLATPAGFPPFTENEWVGRELSLGGVRLRGTLPTARCAVPTLEHGDLPRAPHAVRALLAANRVDVPGFGMQPCAGLYAEVLAGGTIRRGDPVTLCGP